MSKIKFRIPVGSHNGEVVVFFEPSINGKKGRSKVDFQREIINNCLSEILDSSDCSIVYSENGAPYFNDKSMPYISISHSNNWFAVQLCEEDKVGVDIQVIKSDIEKGMRYFVNEKEENSIEINPLNLNIIWAAKETVYKFKKGDLEFYKEAMTVLTIDKDFLTVEVAKEVVKCKYLMKEDFVLVYVVESINATDVF